MKGLFTPSDLFPVTVIDVMLTGKMNMQPILAVTVPVKKIKGAARQCYGEGDGIVQCEQALKVCSHRGDSVIITATNFYTDGIQPILRITVPVEVKTYL